MTQHKKMEREPLPKVERPAPWPSPPVTTDEKAVQTYRRGWLDGAALRPGGEYPCTDPYHYEYGRGWRDGRRAYERAIRRRRKTIGDGQS
jgi:hypothetical protein